jgi:hypothetical protein
MSVEKEARDFRVYWQHKETYNRDTYPKCEPLMTYEEAKKAVEEELNKGYLYAYIIDRSGLMR